MLTWTQLRHPSSGFIRSLTALNQGRIEKLRPTFKPALKTLPSPKAKRQTQHRDQAVAILLDLT